MVFVLYSLSHSCVSWNILLQLSMMICAGATTIAEYRKYIEKDPAFERRFQQVCDQTRCVLVV